MTRALRLAGMESGHDGTQGAHRCCDVGPFVEHHGFGPSPHGGIGDFRPSRHAVPRHFIEHLGGPDAGNVGRRADPEDFLLDLRQFLPAAFDRQVSPGNHHAQGPGIAHRCEQQPGKVEKCSSCFDLQHHGKFLPSMTLEFLLQDFDIRRTGDEGITHDVGMGCRDG